MVDSLTSWTGIYGSSFLDDVDRIFNQFTKENTFTSFPPLNVLVAKESGCLVLELALAGYQKEELDITVDNDILIIRGKGKEKKEDVKEIYRGIKKSQFQVRYKLPVKMYDLDSAAVTFEDGILSVNFSPWERPKKARVLQIK